MQNIDVYIESGLDKEKISLGKLMCLLSIVLFISGIALDYFSAPQLMSEIFLLRIAMCAILGSIFVFIKVAPKAFLKLYRIVISLLFVTSSLTIQFMIFLTEPSDIAHSTYFAGLMLIIVIVFLGTYLTTLLSIILSIISISSFLGLSYIMGSDLNLAVNNGFFLGSALIVGVISNAMKNNNLAQILHLQSSLKDHLRDQDLELKKQSELANIDSITGIANRRYGLSLLEKMINNAATLDMLVAVYFIDLNGFKEVNDTYGHHVGDDVLNITASRLLHIGRKSDVLFRYGGDEFVYAILLEQDNLDFTEEFKNGILNTITPSMECDGLRLVINASIGQSMYPHNGTNANALIEVADAKMYQNKKRYKAEDNLIPSHIETNEITMKKDIVNITSFKKSKS